MFPDPNFSVSTFTPRADWELGSWKPPAPRCSATFAPNTAATMVNSMTTRRTRLGAAMTTREIIVSTPRMVSARPPGEPLSYRYISLVRRYLRKRYESHSSAWRSSKEAGTD